MWDAVVLDGSAGALAQVGNAREFVADQFRHCKAMLVASEAGALLSASGIDVPATPDAGLLQAKAADFGAQGTVSAFVAAVARHKHYARETDPPRV